MKNKGQIEVRRGKEHMEIQLGIGVLWHCPGMTAREARVAVAEFFSGRPTVAQMRDRIRECGGFIEAGKKAFEAYDARHPLSKEKEV